MEAKWLEDFIALVETRSFSRAAQQRFVSQPAFSRRIQALEAWLGADLIDRNAYPTRLTAAGEIFYPQALETLSRLTEARSMARGQQRLAQDFIDLAVPHTLSLTYVPTWIASLEARVGPIDTRLIALNVHDAVLRLVEGGCDLLIVYHHPRQPVQLDGARYDMLTLGNEGLHAYSRPVGDGTPQFALPGSASDPLPFLAYSSSAYLGRMVDLIAAQAEPRLHLRRRHEADMAEGLKLMAVNGHGVAFLPASAVRRELLSGELVHAGPAWGLAMEVRLYRERPTEARPGKPAVNALWRRVAADLAVDGTPVP